MTHNKRIYVCHTYYHVYIALIKELNLPNSGNKEADIVLSKLSTDFSRLINRLNSIDIFNKVIELDEKRETFFPELVKWKTDYHSGIKNLISRIIFTKKFAKLQKPFVTIDFAAYKDIYVFCDSDPIALYLSQNHIHYHAVEDGYNSLEVYIPAKYSNTPNWKLKKFLSLYLNLIFICGGYNKYCIDMEVNDASAINDSFSKYKSVSRDELINSLTSEGKKLLLRAFIEDADEIYRIMSQKDSSSSSTLILTEDLCSLEVRKQIFNDLINKFSSEGQVFIKPHPRDVFDYHAAFPEIPVFDRFFPMEVLNLFENVKFDKAVTIFTPLHDIQFAKEKVFLGREFMDKYEDSKMHEYHHSEKEADKVK